MLIKTINNTTGFLSHMKVRMVGITAIHSTKQFTMKNVHKCPTSESQNNGTHKRIFLAKTKYYNITPL